MIDRKLLIEKAFEAQKFCYTPYSNFNVGAALLGAKKGQVVSVDAPAGVMKYKILAIKK